MAEESKTAIRQKVEEEHLITETDTTRISADAEWFKDCFDLAAALILGEIQFEIKDDGLYLKQMEEARIARTDMFLPKTLFKELKKGREINELRLDVNDTKAILSSIGKGDIITFSIDRLSENDRVGLLVEVKGKRTSRYRLPLFEAEQMEKRDPKIVFATRVRTNIDGLVSTCNKAKTLLGRGSGGKKSWFGTFTLTSNPVGVSLKFASDDNMKKGELQLNTLWDIMQFEGRTDQEVIIAQVYLEQIIKAIAKVTNIVTIEFSTFVPLHITAELPFKGTLAFWVAPRVPDIEAEKIKGRASQEEVKTQ